VLTGGTLDLAADTSITAYNTTVNANVTIQSDKATAASAGITHTLGTLSIGANTLNTTAGANVVGGTPMVAFGATTLTGAATFNPTTAGVALASVTGAAQGLTLGGTATNNTVGAITTTTGTVTKTGTGHWTVIGNATNSGLTTVANGILQVGAGGTSGALGSGNIVDNAALIFSRSDALTVNGAISGTGSVTNQGGAANVLTLGGAQSYATLNANAGTTNVNGSFTNGTSVVNVAANAHLNFGASQTLGALNIGAGAVVTMTATPSLASTAAVPEPGSLAFLTVGALGLLARRRRFQPKVSSFRVN
jgi:autotransporter family porin